MSGHDGHSRKQAAARPLCAAPFNALLIDPDKGVRPCCRYFPPVGHHMEGSVSIGRLEGTTTLASIREGPAWRQVAAELAAHETPIGCRDCLHRERETGYAGRSDYDDVDWDQGLSYLEINSSNVCTLQCRHCDGQYSHRWALVQDLPVHKAQTIRLLDGLRSLDLSRLKTVAFKGGEPLVNPDVLATLQHLDTVGRLAQVEVRITTNGTVVPTDAQVQLLRKARRCDFGVSVDGVGAVQTYIRHGKSGVENVRRLVDACAAIPRLRFGIIVSVMAYNVFSLPAIAAWWSGLAGGAPGSRWRRWWRRWTKQAEFMPLSFFNFVTAPVHLSVSALQDRTRRRLAEMFEGLDPVLYASVIRFLRLPFAGEAVHDQLVVETLRNDLLLGRSWRDAIPELGEEFVLLDPHAALASAVSSRDRDPAACDALVAALERLRAQLPASLPADPGGT